MRKLDLSLRIYFSSLAVISVVGFLLYGWFQNPTVAENSGIYVNYGGVGKERLLVWLLLLLSVAVMWLQKRVWKVVHLVILGAIIAVYVLWGISTYQLMEYVDLTAANDPFLFHGATPWDLVVLFSVLASTFVSLSAFIERR